MTPESAKRYIVGEKLAVGGMAEVFLGQRKSDGKDVVIKKMLPNLSADPTFVKRFLKEGALASQLKHDNIIEIVELVEEGEDVLMVMEAIDGADLATLLKQSRRTGARIPVALSLHIVARIASALVAADETPDKNGDPLRIIHRDVTPSNILISRTGQVKLIDFGIARAPSADNFTRSGFLVGKIHFLAPEQIHHHDIDGRVDVWAAGCVLFQLLTGRRPFDALSEPAVLIKIGTGERKDVRALAIVPEEVAAVVDKALAVDPKDRYKNARAFSRALDDVIAQTGLKAGNKEVAALIEELLPSQQDATPFEGTIGPYLGNASAKGSPKSAMSLALDDGRPDQPVLDDAIILSEESGSDLFSRAPPEREEKEESTVLFQTPPPPPRTRKDNNSKAGVDDVTRTSQAPRPAPTLKKTTGSTPSSSQSKPTGSTPSLAQASQEQVPTTRLKRRQKPQVAPLVIGAALASFALGAGFVVVVGGVRADPDVVVAAAPPPLDPPTPLVLPPVPVPPLAPVTATIAPPVTATTTPEEPKTTTPTTPTTPKPPPPPRPKNGELVVDSRPWSRVTLDGAAWGTTPVTKKVRAGRHTLVLENEEQGLKKTVTVTVTADETETVRVNLKD